MTVFYACFSGLLGAAVLWLAVANARLAEKLARSRDWENFAGRVFVTLLEGLIGAAALVAAFLFVTGQLRAA